LVGDRQCVKQNTQQTSERRGHEEEPQAYPSRIKVNNFIDHHLNPTNLGPTAERKQIQFVQF